MVSCSMFQPPTVQVMYTKYCFHLCIVDTYVYIFIYFADVHTSGDEHQDIPAARIHRMLISESLSLMIPSDFFFLMYGL